MKTHEEVEATLERLGNAWPENDSLVERVLHGLETAPPVFARRPARSRWVQRIAACATVLAAVAFLGRLFHSDDSLFAQTRSAVQRARTFQMVATAPAQGELPPQVLQGVWYERDVGFREESATEVVIGNAEGTWRHLKGARMVVKSRGSSLSEMVDRMLDDGVGRPLKNDQFVKYERYEAGDQAVSGQLCQAYLLTPSTPMNNPELRGGKRRLVYLVDDRSRIVRAINEVRTGEAWTVHSLHDLKYDAPIDRALFEPRFDEGVRVVDIDRAFEGFVDLSKAVHREEHMGLIYAIHHVERFENGGIFLISSVRGTEATLQKYPLKRERNGRGERVTGPAANYYVQPNYVNAFDIELASMNHEGIHVIWRAYIPIGPAANDPFAVGPGKVKLPAGFRSEGGEFGKANFMDDKGVQHPLMWDVVLDVPEPAALSTFDAIARRVYADFTALDAVLLKFLNMGHRGMMATSLSDLRKISAEDYVAAVMDDVRWWKAGCPQDDRRLLELRGRPVPAKK